MTADRVLWTDVDPASRDLRDGAGADFPKPTDDARYDVVEIDTRGYSITYDAAGAVLRDAANVKEGDALRTRLAQSELLSEVKKKPNL